MTSKLTLYDFFCILISGYLIILPFIINEICDVSKSLPFFILAYLVGIVYHRIMEILLLPLRNCYCMIKKGKEKAQKKYNENSGKTTSLSDVDYYVAYYYLMRKNCLNVIPVLEAQVALIKTIYPLIIIYTIFLSAKCSIVCIDDDSRIFIVMILGLLVVTLPCIWYIIQLKVYEFVYEGFYYIQDSDNNEGKNID